MQGRKEGATARGHCSNLALRSLGIVEYNLGGIVLHSRSSSLWSEWRKGSRIVPVEKSACRSLRI